MRGPDSIRARVSRVAKRAVYPGMFDPVHNGHVDVIQRSLRIFDELIVAVVANPAKEPLFTVDQRLEMIDEATADLRNNFRIVAFDGLLIDLVARERADCIVRGIRAVSDFEYEFQMALMNRKLRSTVETVFLMPHEKYTYISSRLIKEVASFGTSVTGMVPPIVEKRLAAGPADGPVSCGAKPTLFNMAVAVLDPGDEVLIPSPYWVSYPEQARLVGGMPVEVPTREATGFDLDPERLAAAVTPRTKAIVLNSPNNPTGAVFSAEALGNVARLAVDAGLLVVSDECYEALTFEGRHVSIASLGPEIKARTLVTNPCSKAYAMTGWRIGYAAGPRALIRALTHVQS